MSFHLVYLCPPPPFHHRLLHAPHPPPLLPFVILLFCIALLLPTIFLVHYHPIFGMHIQPQYLLPI